MFVKLKSKQLFFNLIRLFNLILNLKKNVILIQSPDSYQYNENSKYLFEYLSKKKVNVYWITSNAEVEKKIKKKKFKCVNKKNVIKFIYLVFKTKLFIDAGFSNFFLNLRPNTHCQKILYLGHGEGIKFSKKLINICGYDYYNFLSSFLIKKFFFNFNTISEKKILRLGYPRIEFLLKNKKKINAKKKQLRYLLNNKKSINSKKIILYTPTWRNYSYNLPLLNLKGFNIKTFNQFLKINNIYFFYSLHLNNPPKKILTNHSNIFFINKNLKPLYDTTEFIGEIDILINDCSTTTTEACILKLPQVYIFPDYKIYKRRIGFSSIYKNEIPGPICKDFNTFINLLRDYLSDKRVYFNEYNFKIKKYLKKYNNTSSVDSTKKIFNFIQNLN
jgi:CDP-glycerol glycerophosphotransferase